MTPKQDAALCYPCSGCGHGGTHAANCATNHLPRIWARLQVLEARLEAQTEWHCEGCNRLNRTSDDRYKVNCDGIKEAR